VPIVLGGLTSHNGLPQQPLRIELADAILSPKMDAAINRILKDFNSPGGVGVAVVRKQGASWATETKGYGFAKADGTETTADTLFCIGSNSKARFYSSLRLLSVHRVWNAAV
jgi:CubicO group peptidase (beta-lactamase class C family)